MSDNVKPDVYPVAVPVVRAAERTPFETERGVFITHTVLGEGAMLNVSDLEPDAVIAPHSHPHEQLGLVLSGSVVLTIEGRDHELGPDDAYVLPGGTEHAVRAGPDGCRIVDAFQPVREDYRALVLAAE